MKDDTNGWSKSELYVKDKLEAHDDRLHGIDKQLVSIRETLAAMKVRIAGFVAIAVILATATAAGLSRWIAG